ncbi:MAG: hypothetical protein R3B72_39620 [Polyangiaceae bacterium]
MAVYASGVPHYIAGGMKRYVVAGVVGFIVLMLAMALSLGAFITLRLEESAMVASIALSFLLAAAAAALVLQWFDRAAEDATRAAAEAAFDPTRDEEVVSDDGRYQDEEAPGKPSPVTPTVIDELERLDGPQGSLRHTLAILAVSLVLFIAFESQMGGARFLGYLVLTLVIHEAGHWLAMRAFGYRDLKVFFIPLLGAAVSGRNNRATGTQRAIVSLAGPIPGMLLAIGLAIAAGFAGEPMDEELFKLMFVVNAFNLLPIEPLDGGRLMNVLVYHRFPRVESAMRVLATVAMISAAIVWKDWFLGVFGASFALGLERSARIAKAAQTLRAGLSEDDLASESIPPERREQVGRVAAEEVLRGVDVHARPKILATTMHQLWSKTLVTPPGPFATAVLLTFYGLVLSGLVAIGVSA